MLTLHNLTGSHKNKASTSSHGQTMLTTSAGDATSAAVGKQSQFYKDLCNTFLAVDIPFYKLSNPVLRGFLEKYTNEHIPHESTIRKNYLPYCYEGTLSRICAYTADKKIWVSIDEARDATNRAIGNVVIGTLEKDFPGRIFLLHTEILDVTNHSSIARLFDSAMKILWPSGVLHEHILLFISDAAPYMVKAAGGLQVLYSKMLHVTCLAHALHRVAEEVRACNKNIDSLIANTKRVFAKAPTRINVFKEKLPNVPLPPKPILTRWGRWIEAAQYYAKHFEAVQDVLGGFDSAEAAGISIAQTEFNSEGIKEDLVYVSTIFGCIPPAITELETRGKLLGEAVK